MTREKRRLTANEVSSILMRLLKQSAKVWRTITVTRPYGGRPLLVV